MYCRESMAARTAALISSSTGGRESGTDIIAFLLCSTVTFLLRSRGKPGILAAEVQERLLARVAAAVGGVDLRDEDGVVAARIGVHHGALELGEGIGQDGQAERPRPVVEPGELLVPARAGRGGGEPAGDRLLARAQDVHREAARRL